MMGRRWRDGRGTGVLWCCSAAIVALLAATPVDAGARCTLAWIPWSFALPDGEVRESGQLRICPGRDLNPVTGLHEIRVGKFTLGLFMSRIGESEGVGYDTPVVVFERDRGGGYRLVGYALPNGRSMRTYTLLDARNSGRNVSRIAAGEPPDGSDNGDDTILIAALWD